MSRLNFKEGDVVYIDHSRCPDWSMYKTGTIWSDTPHTKNPTHGFSAGYGSDDETPPDGYPPVWRIRLEGYNYGESDSNSHFISEQAIFSVSGKDVQEAIESILKGSASTTPPGLSDEEFTRALDVALRHFRGTAGDNEFRDYLNHLAQGGSS